MEIVKIQEEEEEDTISRFFGGLNNETSHPVDRSSHLYLEDMYHYAIKVEEQLGEEKEHSKWYTFMSNSFSKSNVLNKHCFVNK